MRKVFFISLIWLPVSWLSGQSITVEVSSNEVEVGERFMISYSFQGGDEVEVPSFRDFEIVYSGNSEGVQFSNGKITRVGSYSFTLVGYKSGTFEIPPATMLAKGKRIKSPSVVIKVKDNGQVAPLQKGQQQMSATTTPSDKKAIKDVILALAETDKKKAYVGEQITLSYNILSRVSYNSIEENKAPQYKGFLTQNIEVDENAEGKVRKFNGVDYYQKEYNKTALFGTFPGTFTIQPMHFKAVALIPEYYPFMGSNTIEVPRNVLLPTNKITLEVMPLPEKGKPENFTGLVGLWDAERNLSSVKVQAGRAVRLTYNVAGVGDVKAVVFPDFNYPEGVDAFEPETQIEEKVFDNSMLGGFLAFHQSLVFREPGTYIIPEYTFSYFDTRLEQYITKTLPELRVEVTPAFSETNNTVAMDGNTFIADIQSGWQKDEKQLLSGLLKGVGAAFPFLVLALVAVYRKGRKQRDVPAAVKQVLMPDLKLMTPEQQYAAVTEYLIRELSPLAGADSLAEIQTWLSYLEDREIAVGLLYIFSACNQARFSPFGAEPAVDLMKQATLLVERLKTHSVETV